MGQLSKKDLFNEFEKENGLRIRLGIKDDEIVKSRAQASSYDLTPSIVAMSVKKGMLETVYKSKSANTNSYYIYVKPKDTVLIVSNEYISFPSNIAGYVTSRVSNVAYGFGHISTTVDPNWNGALLIALSNPSNHSLKVSVGTTTVLDNRETYRISSEQNTLATLTFHYLCNDSTEKHIEYKSLRTDLLENIKYDKRTSFISYIRKIIHYKRRKYTDYFFDYINTHEQDMMSSEGWSDFLDEFSKVVLEQKTTCKACANDYIIKENRFRRLIHFLNDHKVFVISIFILFLLVLYKCNIIEGDIVNLILEWATNKF